MVSKVMKDSNESFNLFFGSLTFDKKTYLFGLLSGMFPPMKLFDLQVFISATPISHFPIDILRPDFRVKNCLQTTIKTLKIISACSQILHLLETCVVH